MRHADVRHVLELVAGSAAAALLTLAAIVYVGRAAGPAQYSDFSAALAVFYLLTMAFGPIVPAIARTAARSNDPAHVAAFRASLQRRALLLCAAAFVLAILAGAPASRLLRVQSAATLVLAVTSALAFAVLSIDRAILQGLFRFRAYNMNLVLESAVRAALLFAMPRQYVTAVTAMESWIAAAILAEAVNAIVLRKWPRGTAVASDAWTDLRALIGPMFLVMLSVAIFQNTDVLAVKRWFAPDEAGAYGAVSSLVRGYGVVFAPFFVVVGPVLTRHSNDTRAAIRIATRYAAAFAIVAVIGLLIVARLSGTILTVLYGGAFARASAVFAPLAGVTMMTYVGLLLAQALITVHKAAALRLYSAIALAQPVALVLFHSSIRDVLAVLYCVQGLAFVVIVAGFCFASRDTASA